MLYTFVCIVTIFALLSLTEAFCFFAYNGFFIVCVMCANKKNYVIVNYISGGNSLRKNNTETLKGNSSWLP